MNAESIAILQVMICETKHEIQGGGNHPPLGSQCYKKSLVALGLNPVAWLTIKEWSSRNLSGRSFQMEGPQPKKHGAA